MKSFDRGANRLAKSLSHTGSRSKRSYQLRNKTVSGFGDAPLSWENASLTKKQLIISCVVGALFPLMSIAGMDKFEGMTGTVLLVLFFFFAIPFFVMVLIFMVFNTITRPRTRCNEEQVYEAEESANDVDAPAQLYFPNPEWMGQTGLVDSVENAEILAPQFLKQAQESSKIFQSTTAPATFFTRYDFCVGRLMELEKCEKYGAFVDIPNELKKYQDLEFRNEAVNEIIHRSEEKYKTKIQSLKTKKARNNWATKFHDAFSEFTPYMSDEQLSVLGESSARLLDLADVDPLEE